MSTMSPQATLAVADRCNFAFSPDGAHGACLRTSIDDDVALERWDLTEEEPAIRTIPDVAVDRRTDVLPFDDGRILLRCGAATSSTSNRHQLALLQPVGAEIGFHWLGELPAPLRAYLVTSPGRAALGFVVTVAATHSTIWRLQAAPPGVEPVVRVPGSLSGGVWLDDDGAVLAVNQTGDGHGCSGIAVDLVQGSWRRIWSASDASVDRIVLYSAASQLLVATTTLSGEERIGLAHLGDPAVRFPDALHRPGYVRKVLAVDGRGRRLLVHEIDGALSRLFSYTPADDRLEPVGCPPGIVSAPASWTGDLIRVPFSAPHHPSTLATVRPGPTSRRSPSHARETEGRSSCEQAHLIELTGPAGPIEAVVHGGCDWRRCEHLVLALHGGPLSAWRFEFDPLFSSLAAAGVAVIAPNYRGSIGYGNEHLRAVIGDWGGADLDDVLHLGRSLDAERRPLQLPGLVVMGASYGAFLALLAACYEPRLWAACVAAAPFLSGRGLHEEARVAVRERIAELGGHLTIDLPIDDALGSRDVLQACASLSAPLLLIHGAADEAIPVEQSRTLRRRLLELGRTEGVDFEYLETDDHHSEVVSIRRKALREHVTRFCVAAVPRPVSPVGERR